MCAGPFPVRVRLDDLVEGPLHVEHHGVQLPAAPPAASPLLTLAIMPTADRRPDDAAGAGAGT
jgi:hypothetical protein